VGVVLPHSDEVEVDDKLQCTVRTGMDAGLRHVMVIEGENAPRAARRTVPE
jgi:cobalamin biosynthesis protein CbiD